MAWRVMKGIKERNDLGKETFGKICPVYREKGTSGILVEGGNFATVTVHSAKQVDLLWKISKMVIVLNSLVEDVVAKLLLIRKALRDELAKPFATIMVT